MPMDASISDQFERALAALCSDERIRAVESGASGNALWNKVDALGFTDALVPAKRGGAGLALADACPLLVAAGRAGLNHPFGETMAARGLLQAAGFEPPPGAIALSPHARPGGGGLACHDVPGAGLASHVLVATDGEWLLLPCAAATALPGIWRPHGSASLQWSSSRDAVFRCRGEGERLEDWCNAVHAAAMAGAMERVLGLAVTHANDRRQFGRAIGQFQAVQQDLAVLAGQAGSAAMAARMGCSGGTHPDPLLAAAAKLRAAEAAAHSTGLAHAVFGAIGITEEHVLGVFTTRLHEWRAAPGTGRSCAERLGRALLASEHSFTEFAREALSPNPTTAAATREVVART